MKRRIKVVQHHYNEMTNCALDPTTTYNQKKMKVQYHALMAEKYQTELFYTE